MICKNCGFDKVVKNGREFRANTFSQRYVCLACGKQTTALAGKVSDLKKDTFRPEVPDQSPKIRTWQAYNDAQMREKLLFLDILQDLCSRLPETQNGKVGRPRASTREMAFCMAAKLYEGLSSRRVSSDLEIAMQRGHISKVPHFNTILKYFNEPGMAPLLESLIRLSSLPLKDFETTFAVDASGLTSAFYSRWLDERLIANREHDWIKIHVICGVKTNIVTAIDVSDAYSHDSPHFPKLIKDTAENFQMKEVCADKGYASGKNLDLVFEAGAVPYILFKANATGALKESKTWSKMFYYFKFHQDEFMARYHQRSNVESTFSMLKRKFSHKLMLKSEVGQVNEALAMLLCHNICVLVKEAFQNGISAEFEQTAHLFPNLHINSTRSPEGV